MKDNRDNYWEIIAKKLHGELNSEEEGKFSRIMTESSNLREFEKVQQIHDDLVKNGPISERSKLRSWEKIENRISHHKIKLIKTAMKYAAIIIFALILRSQCHSDK